MPLVRYGSMSRYEHMAADSDTSGGGALGLESSSLEIDASERDGLNTPPGLPSEPSWMSDPSLGEGGNGAGGALGWRGGRRERGSGSGGGSGSRARTMV